MAIYREMIVPIPPHSYAQKVGKLMYNYTYTNFFRNEDGKARNKSKATGVRLDGSDTQMYPNDNYFSLLKIPRKRKESEVFNVGYAAVTEKAFDELGLFEILSDVFGSRRAAQIRSICAYMVKEGCVMAYINHFSQEEYFNRINEALSSQRVSEIFSGVTFEEMEEFYSRWIPKNNAGHYICYDVTSVSTYSKMITEAEYGYNRDHDKLPQMNIGLFTSEENQYPLFMVQYNGSANDASNIIQTCRNARCAGLGGTFKVVMDGGFFDRKKLCLLHSEGMVISVGMPAYREMVKEYFAAYGDSLFHPDNYLNHKGTYGKIIENQEIFGIEGRVFVGLCTEANALLNDDLDAKIERYEEELKSIAKYSTVIKNKKYTGVFDFQKQPDGDGYTYEKNREKICTARKNFGKFAIFTTDRDITAQGIIDAYRDKDFDEKQFYDLKQYMDARRPRVQSQKTFDGKYSVLLIALILRTWLKKKLGSYMKGHHLTMKSCMMKLSDVKMYMDDNEIRLLKSVTAEQRQLLTLCGVDAELLECSFRKAVLETD